MELQKLVSQPIELVSELLPNVRRLAQDYADGCHAVAIDHGNLVGKVFMVEGSRFGQAYEPGPGEQETLYSTLVVKQYPNADKLREWRCRCQHYSLSDK